MRFSLGQSNQIPRKTSAFLIFKTDSYKAAQDAEAVAQGAKVLNLLPKGLAESTANSLANSAKKSAALAVGGVLGGEAAKIGVNALDNSIQGEGSGKKWCTPFE